MKQSIDNLYFNWLYSNVCDSSARLPNLRFYKLFELLHQTQFVFLISGDDNRVEDGQDLRREFLHDCHRQNENGFLSREGCSVLEMLIAFSRRASFETDDSPKDWFWVMVSNLGLSSVHDATPWNDQAVQDIVDRFVWRTYHSNGLGGLFPLRNPKKDQKKVEIYYQFSEYLFELDYI